MTRDERLRHKRIRGREYYRKNRAQQLINAARIRAVRKSDPIATRKFLDYKRRRAGLPEPTRPCPTHCEICLKPPDAKKSLSLDHDHETGAFRGWLCNSCNMGLGMLGDTPLVLTAALRYLGIAK